MGGPIRVLHVVVNMNRGGAETLLMNIYRSIDRSKVQFDFLTSKEGVFDKEIISLGGRIHRIPYVTEAGHFGYLTALDNFFNANKDYTIVHSHLDKMSGFVLRAAKKAGVTVRISHSHATASEGNIAAKAYKWLSGKYIIPNATEFFACSQSASKWLFNLKKNEARILKNGIKPEEYIYSAESRNILRQECNIDPDMYVIGHVGRFARPKNHSFLIDVFYHYSKINENSILVLAGDGPMRGSMQKKVHDLGLESKVRFLGIRDDVQKLLQAFDIFVFPSYSEGLPVTLIEAQGAGLSCVISDSITREVDLVDGLVTFLPLNNIDKWIETIHETASIKFIRSNTNKTLKQKGYDIHETANLLQDYYLACGG
ncbi:glycosyltransferase family 1 protein [Peribacillus sp. SCS-37]|uniref:glycosyltransferase family 1 protein n=1 Tax=Paraperibacillus esterisolvens TaxID=3115296 RepID=UPI00390653C0